MANFGDAGHGVPGTLVMSELGSLYWVREPRTRHMAARILRSALQSSEYLAKEVLPGGTCCLFFTRVLLEGRVV